MAELESLKEQIACVERELAERQREYPRRVRAGTLRLDEADRELAAMTAVLETLKRLMPPF